MRRLSSSRSALLVVGLLPGPVFAAPTFTVNSLADVPGGANLTDGVCETATGNGVCTLRAAVMEASHVSGGDARIVVPAGVYAITLPPSADAGTEADGDLDVAAPMTIEGAGPSATIVDASHLDRVLEVYAVAATVRGLTLRNGNTAEWGGGIRCGYGDLTLENVVVAGNHAGADGGGIYTLEGTLRVRKSILRENAGRGGGAIYSASGTVRIEDSIIDSNAAAGAGGGVYTGGDAIIERTTIRRNYTQTGEFHRGGGVYAEGSLTMVNDTVTGNLASAQGGGIHVQAGTAHLTHLTVTDNLADNGRWTGTNTGGGIFAAAGSFVFLGSSIVWGNRATYGFAGSFTEDDCAQFLPNPISSRDYNIVTRWEPAPRTCHLAGVVDHVIGADPLLLPLHDNGGFAPDYELTYNFVGGFSPAVNAVPPAQCTGALGEPLAVDGRGYARRGNCDIGAHETASFGLPASQLETELVRNGGAAGNEFGEATSDGTSVQTPYWRKDATYSQTTQVLYGSPGFAAQGDAPGGSGSTFFAGGAPMALAITSQILDVSALATEIDAGALEYRVSAALGGKGAIQEFATLGVDFIGDFGPILSIDLGGASSWTDRGGVTRLLPYAGRDTLPPGTRMIWLTVTLDSADAPYEYNDGYADDISLVIPEPSQTLVGVSALVALAAAYRRSERRDRGQRGRAR